MHAIISTDLFVIFDVFCLIQELPGHRLIFSPKLPHLVHAEWYVYLWTSVQCFAYVSPIIRFTRDEYLPSYFFQDMYEKDNTLYLSADVAGYKKDQIKVRVSVRTTYTWMTALVYVVWNRLTEIVLFIILYLRWRFLSCVSMVIFWPSVPLQRWRSLKKRYANAWQL